MNNNTQLKQKYEVKINKLGDNLKQGIYSFVRSKHIQELKPGAKLELAYKPIDEVVSHFKSKGINEDLILQLFEKYYKENRGKVHFDYFIVNKFIAYINEEAAKAAEKQQQRISAEQQRKAEQQRRDEEQRIAASAVVQQGNCTTYIEKAKKLLKEFNVEKTKIEKDIEKYANERAQAEKIVAEKNAAQKAACSSYAAYADKVKILLEKFISEESSNINKGLPASFMSEVAPSRFGFPQASAPEINNVSSPPSKPPANASAPPVNRNVYEEDPTAGGRRKTQGNHKRGYKRNYKRKGTRKMRR
jgi:hypothetical protein